MESKEHWQRVWTQALANMPLRKIKKHAVTRWSTVTGENIIAEYEENITTRNGASVALARCIGMKVHDSKGRVACSQHIYTSRQRGSRPKDPEIRRKLELCAGPYGKVLAWVKLKELGLEHRYQQP